MISTEQDAVELHTILPHPHRNSVDPAGQADGGIAAMQSHAGPTPAGVEPGNIGCIERIRVVPADVQGIVFVPRRIVGSCATHPYAIGGRVVRTQVMSPIIDSRHVRINDGANGAPAPRVVVEVGHGSHDTFVDELIWRTVAEPVVAPRALTGTLPERNGFDQDIRLI